MENASNALIMAAGILLAVMIISLMTALYLSFGNTTAEIENTILQKEISEFNTQFTKYLGQDLTIHDVVNLIKAMKESNEKLGFTEGSNHNTYKNSPYYTYLKINILFINNHFSVEGRNCVLNYTDEICIKIVEDHLSDNVEVNMSDPDKPILEEALFNINIEYANDGSNDLNVVQIIEIKEKP